MCFGECRALNFLAPHHGSRIPQLPMRPYNLAEPKWAALFGGAIAKSDHDIQARRTRACELVPA